MSEEEKEETVEETPAEEAPVEEAPAEEAAAEEAPAEEAPAEEAPAEEAPAEEAPAEEAPAEEAPAEEAPAEEASDGGDEGSEDGDDEDGEGVSWKDRARLLKSREPVEARPQRTPEERQAERDESRAKAAKARRSRRDKAKAGREPGQGSAPAEKTRTGKPKERQGVVVSNKADKTITVRIDTARRHPVYEKIVRQSHKIHAHDERNEAGEGDVVRVIETRKLSRTKHWRLIEIVEKAR